MKIIQIIPQLSSGGGERFTVDLCNELSYMGHDVLLVSLYPIVDTSIFAKELTDTVRLFSFNKKKGKDLGLFLKLAKLIKRENADIVHSHLLAIDYLPLAVLLNGKTKFFHTVHSDAEKEAIGGLSEKIRRWAFGRKNITPVTISKASQQSFTKFYGFEAPLVVNGRNIPDKIQVSDDVHNEIISLKHSPNTKIIIHLARFHQVKRQDLMVRVAKRLQVDGFDFSILFIGKKHDDMYDKMKAANCSCCHILGEKNNPLEYLAEADAYGLCSSYEGLPISLIEALGVGVVPICTPVGGIINVIKNGVNGFLSDSIEEDDYYYAMKKFLSLNKDEMTKMKEEAKKSYKPYSMHDCALNYQKLYINV